MILMKADDLDNVEEHRKLARGEAHDRKRP
jgi:hypothetical protein